MSHTFGQYCKLLAVHMHTTAKSFIIKLPLPHFGSVQKLERATAKASIQSRRGMFSSVETENITWIISVSSNCTLCLHSSAFGARHVMFLQLHFLIHCICVPIVQQQQHFSSSLLYWLFCVSLPLLDTFGCWKVFYFLFFRFPNLLQMNFAAK